MQRTGSTFIMITILGVFLVLPELSAQSSLPATVAGLKQDIAMLNQQVRALRLEVEQMHHENAALQERIAKLSSLANLLREEYQTADESNRHSILAEVSRQLKMLAKEIKSGSNVIADTSHLPSATPPSLEFPQDYPKMGVEYTVESGDTLSGIARDYSATVKDIQNANQIADPLLLQVGQTIFIPIAQ